MKSTNFSAITLETRKENIKMEIFLIALIVIGVLWALISGIIAICNAWRTCIALGDSSHFMTIVLSEIGGNWIAVLGILLLCLPVWLILSIVLSGKNNTDYQKDNSYQEITDTVIDDFSKTKRVQQKITVGRSSSCDIYVSENYDDISRYHAVISNEDNHFIFEDVSKNGSYINGHKVHRSKYFVKHNDKIMLGKSYTLSWGEIERFFL